MCANLHWAAVHKRVLEVPKESPRWKLILTNTLLKGSKYQKVFTASMKHGVFGGIVAKKIVMRSFQREEKWGGSNGVETANVSTWYKYCICIDNPVERQISSFFHHDKAGLQVLLRDDVFRNEKISFFSLHKALDNHYIHRSLKNELSKICLS